MPYFIVDDMDAPSGAAPQPVAPAAPPHHTLPEKRTVEIEIPHGVKAGNQITVNLPNGKTVKVTVPTGMHAGNKITINCKLLVYIGWLICGVASTDSSFFFVSLHFYVSIRFIRFFADDM